MPYGFKSDFGISLHFKIYVWFTLSRSSGKRKFGRVSLILVRHMGVRLDSRLEEEKREEIGRIRYV